MPCAPGDRPPLRPERPSSGRTVSAYDDAAPGPHRAIKGGKSRLAGHFRAFAASRRSVKARSR
ncbi:hypothetical protein GCM10027612_61100 [Microbispora bryophytorum subsp. camponoti]